MLPPIEAKPDQKIVYNFPSFAYASSPTSLRENHLAEDVRAKLHSSMNGNSDSPISASSDQGFYLSQHAIDGIFLLTTLGSAYLAYNKTKSASSAIAWGLAGYIIPRAMLEFIQRNG